MKKIMGKWILAIPALVAVALTTGILILTGMMENGAASQIQMGQKYLEELSYEQAIIEFGRAIQVEPKNSQAQIGLAKAYLGEGDRGTGMQLLRSFAQNTSDLEALEEMSAIFLENGDIDSANWLINLLIDATDSEEYYSIQEELLEGLDKGHPAAISNSHSLILSGQAVTGTGGNRFGQLGSGQGNGDDSYSANNLKVAFSGQASKVFCGSNTSYIVDAAGDLWSSGLNVTGQLGTGSATLDYINRFTKVEGAGRVVSVAAGGAHTLILSADGMVYGTGSNALGQLGGLGKTVHTPGRVPGVSRVKQIAAAGAYSLALQMDGSVYLWGTAPGYGESIKRPVMVAQNALSIACADGYYAILSSSGEIRMYGTVPIGWFPENLVQTESYAFLPQVTATGLSLTNDMVVWQDYGGTLHAVTARQGYAFWESINPISMDANSTAVMVTDSNGDMHMLTMNDSGQPQLSGL